MYIAIYTARSTHVWAYAFLSFRVLSLLIVLLSCVAAEFKALNDCIGPRKGREFCYPFETLKVH